MDASDAPHDPQQAALAMLQQRLERERLARKAAECLLTDKSHELWDAMQAAQHAERRLQLALRATGEGIWEWDVAAGLVQISHLELAGQAVPVQPMTMAGLLDRIHPSDRATVHAVLEQHLRGEIGKQAHRIRRRNVSGPRRQFACR